MLNLSNNLIVELFIKNHEYIFFFHTMGVFNRLNYKNSIISINQRINEIISDQQQSH